MKKSIKFLMCLLFVGFLASGVSAEEVEKDSWYIGFGLGGGKGWLDADVIGSKSYNEYFDMITDSSFIDHEASPAISFNFGVGAIMNDYFHLGFELSFLTQSAEYDSNETVSLQASNYLLVGTFFPMKTGLSFKAGLGLASFLWEMDSSYGDVSETYTGYSALVGVGYDFNFGSSFNLGLHIDYSMQHYDDKDLNNASHLSVYVSFYWF